MKKLQTRLLLLPLAAMLVVLGCQDRTTPTASNATESNPGHAERREAIRENDPGPDDRKSIAVKAKDALFARLSGRLMEVMQSDGPAAAISVCSNEAITIAESVGNEYGVEIGRTSFKLRNPNNKPRDWVKPFVEKRVDTPQYAQLEDGSLGALYPIHISVKCLMCHGGEEDILEAVKPELARRYSDDAATGFKLNDLRGWFWVEITAARSSPADKSEASL